MRRTLIADGSGNLPALETRCATCDGEGRIPNRRDGNRIEYGGHCNACNGGGAVPTEDGKRLLEFLRWNRH